MNMKLINLGLVLSVLAIIALVACVPQEEPKVSQAEAEARLKVAESLRGKNVEEDITFYTEETEEEEDDYFTDETLSWDHEANAAHGWNYFSVGPQRNSTYMGVHCITDESSEQWQWLQSHDWGYDERGVCTYDGRVMVALTDTFGSVGDSVDLLLADETVLPVIIVDQKADCDVFGHWRDGKINVLELIVSPGWYEENHENISYPDVIGWKEATEEDVCEHRQDDGEPVRAGAVR